MVNPRTPIVLAGLGLLNACASMAPPAEPNWAATPSYGTASLNAGFAPDPWTQQLSAGGSDDISRSVSSCTGYIHAAAPDVDLNYVAGTSPLYIHAESEADTTLAVLDPNGIWHCNDDAVGFNPMVTLQQPPSGNYNIWVGRFGSEQLSPAQLHITESSPADPDGTQASVRAAIGQASQAGPLNWEAVPTFGTVDLSAGTAPVSRQQKLRAGGDYDVALTLNDCAGNINAAAPDIDINYEAGSHSLYLQVEAEEDTTLIVFDPQGDWHCNDDALDRNPLLVFDEPVSGNYNVWVGVFGSSQTAPANLHIRETDPRD